MSTGTLKKKTNSSPTWIGAAIVVLAIAISSFASWLLYQQTITLLTENLRERLLSISVTQAANIDAEDLEALQNEEDWQKPEWEEVVSHLAKAKAANNSIVFMYIFRKTAEDPTQMEFVADAGSINPYANSDDDPTNDVDANGDGIIEPDGADYLQWPGQPYDEAVDIPEAYAAYDGPLTAAELYEDTYGQVLSGYAPIRDKDGNVVAVLATDIKADDFFQITRQTLYPFLTFIVALTFIIFVLAIVLIFLWKRRADDLAEVDHLKDEFLSIASHQLRAPVTAIRGYAANLNEGLYGAVPDYLKDPLYTVQESARLMANSIEDYLNISRIEQGRMKYERGVVDISDLAHKVVVELTPVAAKKNLSLKADVSGPVMFTGDIGKLKQILVNLVDNAIKYTQKGGITISVAKEANRIKVIVTDTGVGIAPDEIGGLFAKFKRARGANMVNATGTGLGLYVARQLAQGHGGTIRAESEGTGKGSRFIVELPA